MVWQYRNGRIFSACDSLVVFARLAISPGIDPIDHVSGSGA
jgi:hypothetical protein